MLGGVKFWHPMKYDVFEIYFFAYSDLGNQMLYMLCLLKVSNIKLSPL